MTDNTLQAMFNGMAADWQRERAQSQMTLGGLIDRLASMPPETMMAGLENPHSYRGYYIDLSFENAGKQMPASEVLAIARGCMGEVFEGYKGGDFQMGRLTPIWLAAYGCTGKKIMAVRDDGALELADDNG